MTRPLRNARNMARLRRERIALGLCYRCGLRPPAPGQRGAKSCRVCRRVLNEYCRQYRERLRVVEMVRNGA